MTKTEELLKVLDLPKYEQFEFLCNREIIDKDDYEAVISAVTEEQQDYLIDRILADLAFRLRDEAVKRNTAYWSIGICNVQEHINSSIYCWFELHSRPIHWIIAALIAKELSKAEKE